MITLATEPDYVAALYEKLTEAWLENLRRFTAAVGDRVQILQFNDDLGTQDVAVSFGQDVSRTDHALLPARLATGSTNTPR